MFAALGAHADRRARVHGGRGSARPRARRHADRRPVAIAVRIGSVDRRARRFELDATPYTVVGVLPAALRLPLDYASRTFTQIWVPLALGPVDPQERGNHGLNALGRLTARRRRSSQAQAEIDTITRGFLQQHS